MQAERSVATLLSDIVGNLQQIVRAEVRLAKNEIREEARRLQRGAILLVAGGLLAAIALVVLLFAGVYALGQIWPLWLAALVVGGGTAVIGLITAWAGLRLIRHVTLPPPRSAAVIEGHIQWAKSRLR
jgi:hypothetical protein